jgi:hypothetical protein
LPVRIAAAQTLAQAADFSAVLVQLLDAALDPSSMVAEAAVTTVRGFGAGLLPLAPGLLRKPPDWFTSRGAWAVASLGVDALPAVLTALQADDPVQEINGMAVLAAMDEAGVRATVASLKDDRSPTAERLRHEMGLTLARLSRKATASSRAPTVFPVAGFDTDLLALDVLEKHRKHLPRAFLFQVLQDGRVAVVVNALSALALHGPPDASEGPTLCVLLKSGSASVRAAAARALHKAEDVPATVQALVACSSDKDSQVRQDVATAVQTFGVAAIPVLIGALRVDPAIADVTVLPLLVSFGDATLAPLVLCLVHPEQSVRANALAGIIMLGHEALQASQRRSTAMAADPAPEVQALARQALALIARQSRPLLLEPRALPLDDFADRVMDDAALKKAGRKLESTALQALAHDGRPVVRANAWKGLAALGPLDAATALVAAVACKDSDAAVRREAALALRHCPNDVLPMVLPPLVVASRDADKAVAQAARQAVFSHGKVGAEHLVALFGERDGRVHEPAVALAIALDADAAAAVVVALDAALPLIRANALTVLAGIAGKWLDDAAPKVVARLGDSYDPARVQAVLAVAAMSPATWKKHAGLKFMLLQMWRGDPSLPVRTAAERALAKLSAAG